MSFYTSLTGLNGAQADIAAISNNIANTGTTGFKRSRAEFGDIFATSPLQAASSAIGSGTILKSIKQQFTQGNIESSLNALDLAISGQGFFALKPSLTSTQTVYTRNGAFSVNNDRYVVDAQGQLLQVFPVNADGSVIATGINSAKNLQLPTTSGLPKASETIQLGLNLPADATIIPTSGTYSSSNPYVFDKTNAATYNKSTSITIYDSLGNSTIATIYYVKTSNATEASPTNKWQTHVFVGDREVTPQLITAKDDQTKTYYINKFGQITNDPQAIDPTFNASAGHPLYKQDEQINKSDSTSAAVLGGIIKTGGFDFGDTDANKVKIITDPEKYNLTRESLSKDGMSANPPYWGVDMFSVSVDGSAPQSVSVQAGEYTGTQLAAELTRAVNAKFGGAKYFSVTDTYRKDQGTVVPGNDIIQINLSKLSDVDGSSIPMATPLEIDLLGASGSSGTPPVSSGPMPENKMRLTRDELVALAQVKLNDALRARHLEFGKTQDWPDASAPPIKVGYDVSSRSFTFTVDQAQLGPDANELNARFNSIQVTNPTDMANDLGIPPKTTSPDVLIRSNTLWSGTAALPGGDPIVDPREQRTGIKVVYNKDTRQFSFLSGSTGEASSITVGRPQLATDNTKLPQIDSFKLQKYNFAYQVDTLTTKPITTSINLEINGRNLGYVYTPRLGATTTSGLSDFFYGLKQAAVVTFDAPTDVTVGGQGTSPVKSVKFYGRLMNGDQFQLKLPATPSSTAPTALTIGPLVISENASDEDRVKALNTAITAALAAYPSVKADILASTDNIKISYTDTGAAAMPAFSQTVRGTDEPQTDPAADPTAVPPVLADPDYASFTTPQALTDTTIVAGVPSIIDGTSNTYNTQTIGFTTPEGQQLDASFKAGDVYNISVPQSDGLLVTLPVTLLAGGIDGLKAAINAKTSSFGVTVTTQTDTTSIPAGSLQLTYLQKGHITGTIGVVQVAAGSGVTATPPSLPAGVRVRTNTIGPISVIKGQKDGDLQIIGSPAGSSFRLNLRINGQPVSKEPVGANGSNSQSGLQVGSAKLAAGGSNDLLGIGAAYTSQQRFVAGTGLGSTAATAIGTRGVTPMAQTFLLNANLGENVMTFTVDGIVGTVTLPVRAYTGDTFAAAIQDRVNQIQDPVTGRTVSGVTVRFEPDNNRLVFTSGTAGASSQINVVGHANFGLAKVTQKAGSVPVITNLKQATDEQGNKLYVDAKGQITTQAPEGLQNWYPLYLQEGQLTFDTIGKLISPKEGVIYSPFDPQNGSDLLRLNIDYGKFSTQFSSPFSVLSLSQDGYPSGSLNGLDIDASGTIRANYTNGQTTALGKVMVANFANANGLKQIGNANYVATSVSGQVVLGQAGADGFGTIKAGALERSNVDITEELVNLITAQRNFQANAKAIETTTTLSQTIIQIRG